MKKKIINFIIIISLILSGIVGGMFIKEFIHYKRIQNKWNEVSNQCIDENLIVDWDALKKINNDVIAWVYIPEIDIAYPVLHSKNNNEYIRKDIYRNYDEVGSIFLDANNEPNFTDNNSIIYGHSVQYLGGMFTNLNKFNDIELIKKVKQFYILTPDNTYQCKIKAFAKTDSRSVFYNYDFNNVYTLDDEPIKIEKEEILEKMEKDSIYFKLKKDDLNKRIVTLSTCAVEHGLYTNQRYVLLGIITNVY